MFRDFPMPDPQVTVVSCMVDRICAERSICSSGTIAIEAENHAGSIVMLEPPKQVRKYRLAYNTRWRSPPE
jgi:hypothetical protein